MKSLTTPKSLKELATFEQKPMLYAFDFDGTLAKIVTHPASARISQKQVTLLKKLAQIAPVAIISGRSVADLKTKIPFPVKFLIGNHGLEGTRAGKKALVRAKKICSAWTEQLTLLQKQNGVELEDKTFSLAIHYRHAPQPKKLSKCWMKP